MWEFTVTVIHHDAMQQQIHRIKKRKRALLCNVAHIFFRTGIDGQMPTKPTSVFKRGWNQLEISKFLGEGCIGDTAAVSPLTDADSFRSVARCASAQNISAICWSHGPLEPGETTYKVIRGFITPASISSESCVLSMSPSLLKSILISRLFKCWLA